MRARLRGMPVPTPVILAAVLVLSVWFGEGVSPYGALRAVLIAVMLGAAIWLVLWAALRSPDRAALAGALVVLALWNTPDWWKYLLGAAAVAILPLGAPFVRRLPIGLLQGRRMPWRPLALGSAVFSLALLITPVISWIGWGGPALLGADLAQGTGLARLASAPAPIFDASNGPAPGAQPDIYLLLLDEHSRQDALQRDFDVDDSAFLAALRQRGFDVASNSHSNYDSTEFTLASMLQMQYLDSLPAITAAAARGEPIDATLRDVANTNPVFAAFRQRGYTVVTTAPWFEHTVIRRSDVFVDSGLMNEFESQLLLSTTIGRIIDQVLPSWMGDQYRANVAANFAAAGTIAATPSAAPRLVLVHVPAPHEPYVFGADGSPVPTRIGDLYAPFAGTTAQLDAKAVAYGNEVRWVDQQAIAAVDSILHATTRPAVVIVFGDHGSRLPVAAQGQGDIARVENLFAALTPGQPGLFGDSPSLINVFPKLLDAYLGASQPLLPTHAIDYYGTSNRIEVPLPSGP